MLRCKVVKRLPAIWIAPVTACGLPTGFIPIKVHATQIVRLAAEACGTIVRHHDAAMTIWHSLCSVCCALCCLLE